MTTFVCPVCDAPCPTLRDLLLCHPRELRAITDAMGPIKRVRADVTLRTVICQTMTPAVRRHIWLALNPETPEVAA